MNEPARVSAQRIDREVSRELTRIRREHPVRHPVAGSKCRVCMDPDAKRRVNAMLASLMRPQEIVENIADLNEHKRKNAKIGYWSVRDHRERHFNLQEPAKEAVRRTMERRAAEEGALIAEGVGNLLNLRGMLEITANKGFAHLLKDTTEVPFEIGLLAQEKLEKILKEDDANAHQAAIKRDVALIQQAIIETLTPEQMKAVSHRLAVLRGDVSEDEAEDDTLDAEVDEDYDEDDDDSDYVADVVVNEDED